MQKTLLTIILSVLVTIIILGGIFMLWQNKENSLSKKMEAQGVAEQMKQQQKIELDNKVIQGDVFLYM